MRGDAGGGVLDGSRDGKLHPGERNSLQQGSRLTAEDDHMVARAERQLRAAVAVELRRGGTELGHAAEQEKTRRSGHATDTVKSTGRIEERRGAGVVAVDVEGAFAFDVHAPATGGRYPVRGDSGKFDGRTAEFEGGDERLNAADASATTAAEAAEAE